MRNAIMCALACASLMFIPACQLLDHEIPVVDTAGNVTGSTTVGEIIAEPSAQVGGSVVTAITANPILGGAAAAAIAGLFGTAASRRKKKQVAAGDD